MQDFGMNLAPRLQSTLSSVGFNCVTDLASPSWKDRCLNNVQKCQMGFWEGVSQMCFFYESGTPTG